MIVTAPATTANLGPGFDCLGAALSIGLTVETVETGGGEPFPKRILDAIRAGGGPSEAVRGSVTSSIPQARGLGSSAACVAAGLLIGCAMSGREPDLHELLRAGTPIEGHPDNLAPALFGGFTIVGPDGAVTAFTPASSVRPLIFVPREQLKTAQARRVLPDVVPLSDAIANLAMGSALVAMLGGIVEPTPERLLEATGDRLHQPYRARLMPRTTEAIAALRDAGVAAAVSGAGPSVICLVMDGTEAAARGVFDEQEGWEPLNVDWSTEGARLVEVVA